MQTAGLIMMELYMQDNQGEREKRMTEEEKIKRIESLEREIEVIEKEIELAKKKKQLEEIQGFRVRDSFPEPDIPVPLGPATPLQPYYEKDFNDLDWWKDNKVWCLYQN